MKHLKKFESFADELLTKIGGPDKEIKRPELVGKPYNYKGLPDVDVVYAVEFVPNGTFVANENAEEYLRGLGYRIGSMEQDNPIGFSNNFNVPKWGNIREDGKSLLDGAIVPLPEFREGGSLILFFEEPMF